MQSSYIPVEGKGWPAACRGGQDYPNTGKALVEGILQECQRVVRRLELGLGAFPADAIRPDVAREEGPVAVRNVGRTVQHAVSALERRAGRRTPGEN